MPAGHTASTPSFRTKTTIRKRPARWSRRGAAVPAQERGGDERLEGQHPRAREPHRALAEPRVGVGAAVERRVAVDLEERAEAARTEDGIGLEGLGRRLDP